MVVVAMEVVAVAVVVAVLEANNNHGRIPMVGRKSRRNAERARETQNISFEILISKKNPPKKPKTIKSNIGNCNFLILESFSVDSQIDLYIYIIVF